MEKCCKLARVETVVDFNEMGVDSKSIKLVCEVHGTEYLSYSEDMNLETMDSEEIRIYLYGK